ncbi:MAG: Ser/Thr protein kinase RdoA (MazF antagonist) [Myxococcota bacterium]
MVDPQKALAAFTELNSPTATPITTGLLHQTFGVRDSSGRQLILQRVNPVFSKDVNRNIQAVTKHLASRDIATLSLVECDGLPFVDLGDEGLWRLMTRLSGVAFDRAETPAQLQEAGKLVANFHRALYDFEAPLYPLGFPYHDTAQHIEDLAIAVRDCTEHPLHRDIAALAKGVFEAARDLPSLHAVPARVIHGDLKFNNLLFKSATGRATALIDLDTLSRMPLAYDWGDAFRSWCNRRLEDEPEAELDLELFRAACTGLATGIDESFTPKEISSLAWGLEIVSLELCARFATDALRESYFGWDNQRFQSAGEHNRSRARGQFDLYRQARDTHTERAELLAS